MSTTPGQPGLLRRAYVAVVLPVCFPFFAIAVLCAALFAAVFGAAAYGAFAGGLAGRRSR